MKILLTGATGFLGHGLATRLAARHDVHALARDTGRPGLDGRVHWIEADLSTGLDQAALPRVDAIVHLAQSTGYKDFPRSARDLFQVNLASTAALLDHARACGAQRFVYASTGGVYTAEPGPITEDRPTAGTDYYTATKRAGEDLVRCHSSLFETVILRPFFIYGPGQERMLVPTLLQRILAGETITIQGDPGMRMNPIHVSDAAAAFEAAIEQPATSGTFNLAGRETITLKGLVHHLATASGADPHIVHTDAVPRDLVADTTRIEEVLGVRPETSLADGLRETVRACMVLEGE